MIKKPLTPQELERRESQAAPGAKPAPPQQSTQADQHISTLTDLLSNLDEAPSSATTEKNYQDHLVRARLGVASSLFTSLRAKHPPTAAHCLRVALGCSSWALQLDVTDEYRDEIEMAALLHDIGKIGVPETVLMKASRLTEDERLLMDRHRQIGLEILRGCSPSESLLKTVHFAGARFDGSKPGFDLYGEDIPFGSRMISIIDAFDSMTTEHVYRKAMSRERAMGELFEHSGTQFDPRLVKDFCSFVSEDRVRLESQVARRWLQDLDARAANMIWQLGEASESDFDNAETQGFASYHNKLLETMHDGVVYFDNTLRIIHWNHGAERITGLTAESVLDKRFDPAIFRMRDESGEFLTEANCPVAETIASGSQSLRRVSISSRNEKVQLNAYFSPVVARDATVRGVTMLLHDASSQVSLEENVQLLRERATRDQLTKVANRAEFDRVHAQLVQRHKGESAPFSLVICDIDHFKSINDTFGHQAGDDVLVSFASLLRSCCRSGDLVARYGGEEFCILCADCDNASATRQAEEIRQKIECTPHDVLGGKCITASFGVTELQGGDTAETMLRRADRALYQAKDLGRNRVVQLGSGITEVAEKKEAENWFSWLTKSAPELVFKRQLVTSVPLSVSAEKLKGFVADHDAEIVSVEENRATLKIDGHSTPKRRMTDRSVPFVVDLQFSETRTNADGEVAGQTIRTVIDVVVQPTRRRDRRRNDMSQRAQQLLVSLKSYFMAQEVELGSG